MQFRLKTLLIVVTVAAAFCAATAYVIKVVEGTPEQRLLRATRIGDWETAKRLLVRAPSIDVAVRDKFGFTPLHYACIGAPTEVLAVLAAKGADLNAAAGHKILPAHFAASFHNMSAVSFLRENGAEVSPAIDLGDHVVAEGAEGDMTGNDGSPFSLSWINGDTPLHLAVRGEDIEAVKYLLRHGANRNARDGYGQTPIEVARGRGYSSVAKILDANQ